ncbi:MAG: carboxypeptidase M32, partial [Gammaproteobacteria bacterium]|nr:carboxypeptidase M32 [Gammaproteobacteria bacterium]
MPQAGELYEGLEERFRTIGHLRHAESMLSWDEAVMMPSGGGKVRADALAALAGTVHSLEAAPDIAELTEAALEREDDPWRRANLGQMARVSRRARALPEDLVTALTRASAASEQGWRTARGANDFDAVATGLEEVLALTRERGKALAEAAGDATEPYDALLDEYEPGLTRAIIDPIFAELRDVLPDLIDRAISRQAPAEAPTGPFPIAAQADLGRSLMHKMGFDFERGRLDVSHHLFCG